MPRRIKEFEQIRSWARERGLYEWGDLKSQTVKLGEEYGELCRGIMKQDKNMVKDAIGDLFVVLVNASHLAGFSAEECMEQAWDEIKDRKGKMDGGTFVKENEEIDVQPIVVKLPHGAPFDEKLLPPSINCTICGIDLNEATGYVCNNPSCPHQNFVTCKSDE